MINFLEELEEKLKLPLLEDGKGFKVVYLLSGAYLEGHLGILKLEENEIAFKIKKGSISFFGNALKIARLDSDCALIKGTIIKVERG